MKIFIALFAAVAACSSENSATPESANCDTPSKCPNESPSTAAEHDRCVATLADPSCGPLLRASLTCARDKAPCGADGKVNVIGLRAACATELAAIATNARCAALVTGTADAGS